MSYFYILGAKFNCFLSDLFKEKDLSELGPFVNFSRSCCYKKAKKVFLKE